MFELHGGGNVEAYTYLMKTMLEMSFALSRLREDSTNFHCQLMLTSVKVVDE